MNAVKRFSNVNFEKNNCENKKINNINGEVIKDLRACILNVGIKYGEIKIIIERESDTCNKYMF